jgi:hypothetical protein
MAKRRVGGDSALEAAGPSRKPRSTELVAVYGVKSSEEDVVPVATEPFRGNRRRVSR